MVVLIAVIGSLTAAKIIVILGAWFAVLGLIALGFEMLTQVIGRAFRNRR